MVDSNKHSAEIESVNASTHNPLCASLIFNKTRLTHETGKSKQNDRCDGRTNGEECKRTSVFGAITSHDKSRTPQHHKERRSR